MNFKFSRNLLIVIFLAALFGGWVGYFIKGASMEKEEIEEMRDLSIPKDLTSLSPKGDKTIVIKRKQDGVDLVLQMNGTEEVIGQGMMIGAVNWSPDEKKISYSDGTPSLGTTVEIIDLDTKKNLVIDQQVKERFTALPEAQGKSFGHIYSMDVMWLDNNSLLVQIVGRSDTSNEQVTKFFVVSAETGDVIQVLGQ